MVKQYWVLLVVGDVEPEIVGPARSMRKRDEDAKRLKAEFGDSSGIFALNINEKGQPSVGAYSGAFFETD